MNTKHLKLAFFLAIGIALVFLTAWEMYWRTQSDYYYVGLDDDRYLWAEKRALVETATPDDVIIIGSSRTAFNFNTNIWTDLQGRRPINLSTDGKPPGPFLEDIVENTDFNGTIIMGVTTLLFFNAKEHPFWQDANQWVVHYHKQTYAQQLGHQLAKPLQRNLVMLTATELDFANDLDLKSLIKTIPLKNRIDDNFVLPKFGYGDEHRNLFMYPSMTTNPAFAQQVQAAWTSFLPSLPPYEVIAEGMPGIIDHYAYLINKFTERGGKIIMIRHRCDPQWEDHSRRMLPRAMTWDKLVAATNVPAYYSDDHPFMQPYITPDWSHMAADDAVQYTTAMVERLIADGHLTRHAQ